MGLFESAKKKPPPRPRSPAEKPDYKALESKYNFTAAELHTMEARFLQLYDTDTDLIAYDVFCAQPEVAMCPICSTFVQHNYALKPDAPPGLTFSQFVSVLSPLSVKASREDKVRYALLAVGAQGHGADARVSRADYANFIRIAMGERIPPHVCDAIADQVIVSRDKRRHRKAKDD
eukprot:CAMPEP_0182556862 /NCGR_PEP_ID=MMETSP1324-20130603/994_1 /TAXON_ID=236786 /ORGANISM="Florenciella sp., Strain RCC1587" /LENGTH=175 /DNA_ID=CAMNT_0024768827 /DNA_START=94 /DNA_END=618 /DNA_ORIENTATION=-